MNNRKITQVRTTLFIMLAVFLLTLSACSSGGAGDGGNLASSTPAEENLSAISSAGMSASGNVSNIDAASSLSLGLGVYGSFAVIVDNWAGEEGTYTYGSSTITVSRTGDTWTWTYNDSGDTMVYTITKGSSGWSFTWTYNGDLYLEGFIAFGGLSGNITVYDETNGDKLYEIAWAEAADPYYLTYTVSAFSSGSLISQTTVTTTADGSAGTYTYDDVNNNANDDSGSW